MARHVFYIPDCPKCGREMVKRSTFNGGWTHWWRCDGCDYDTERTDPDGFREQTAELTAKLREVDE